MTNSGSGVSPRMRSGLAVGAVDQAHPRSISAYAERTSRRVLQAWRPLEHLRPRGAYALVRAMMASSSGASPRMRSGQEDGRDAATHPRNIYAGAEETKESHSRPPGTSEHLRLCRADPVIWAHKWGDPGTSPRTRGALRRRDHAAEVAWSISAYAEQTKSRRAFFGKSSEHLHIRGADTYSGVRTVEAAGTSPRTRSGTRDGPLTHADGWDHLRVRGADWRATLISASHAHMERTGTPSRVRAGSPEHLRVRGTSKNEQFYENPLTELLRVRGADTGRPIDGSG